MAAYYARPLPTLGPIPMESIWPRSEHRLTGRMPQGKLCRPDLGSTATAVHQLKVYDPLYYNSLVDKNTKKHLTKPTVHQHLHYQGLVSKDGTVHPTRQEQVEANRTYRFQEEREALLLKVEAREQARLRRLRKAARAGDITFTRDGIYETKPCYTCKVKHKVASITNPIEPCPGSRLAKYNVPQHLAPLPEPYRTRRSHQVGLNLRLCLTNCNGCYTQRSSAFVVNNHSAWLMFLIVLFILNCVRNVILWDEAHTR